MEIVIKAAAAALTAAVIGLLIKQKNPELALLLSVCTVTMILLVSVGLLSGLRELIRTVQTMIGSHETLTSPLIKCFAVALVTKLTAELCTDASNRAAAAAIELAGTICAASLMMPLLISVLKMIGGMI